MTVKRDPRARYDELTITDRNTGCLLFSIVAMRPPGSSDASADRELRRMVEHLFPGALDKCSANAAQDQLAEAVRLALPGRH